MLAPKAFYRSEANPIMEMNRITKALFAIAALGLVAAQPPAVNAPKELTVKLGEGVKLELVLIPPGEFMMGAPESEKEAGKNAKPQHKVRITKPFYLGKYPVTQEQWQVVMGKNPSEFKGAKNPVENVNWLDCQQFVERLNQRVGGAKFKLPSEAQWEYACRAGSKTRYSFGDDENQLGEYAWFHKNSGGRTHPVGLKKPNAWGLYEMHGNVIEWCADWYDSAYYANSPTDDPTGPESGYEKVNRGGDWISLRNWSYSYRRSFAEGGIRSSMAGLRISRVLAEK